MAALVLGVLTPAAPASAHTTTCAQDMGHSWNGNYNVGTIEVRNGIPCTAVSRNISVDINNGNDTSCLSYTWGQIRKVSYTGFFGNYAEPAGFHAC